MCLVDRKLTQLELCEALHIDKSGTLSAYLEDLEASGFIARDYKYNLKTGTRSKFSQYRLKDNYLRFYLKVIEPKRNSLESGSIHSNEVFNLLPWDSILGLQFENLVLNNLDHVLTVLEINRSTLINAAPYFQNSTQRQKSTQVDLLIQCKNTIYLCEIKLRNTITSSVIDDMKAKISRINIPSTTTIRPVLIYVGSLESAVEKSGFFDCLLSFDELLKN